MMFREHWLRACHLEAVVKDRLITLADTVLLFVQFVGFVLALPGCALIGGAEWVSNNCLGRRWM